MSDEHEDFADLAEFGFTPPGKRYFSEDYSHPDATADARTFIDFDWGAVESTEAADLPAMPIETRRLLIEALNRILQWAIDGDKLTTTGHRVIALAWVVNPALFNGISISEIARKLDLHPSGIARYTGEVSRKFGVRNRSQAHYQNREARP